MPDEPLEVRPYIEREPVHHTITPDQISTLVDNFYGKVRQNEQIGPIFDRKIGENWQIHLDKMKGFWRSVLLKTGEYKGRPLPVHFQIKDQTIPDDYRIWLEIFRETARETFTPEAADVVIATAERIAQSFWMGIFANPMEKTPGWMMTPPVAEA